MGQFVPKWSFYDRGTGLIHLYTNVTLKILHTVMNSNFLQVNFWNFCKIDILARTSNLSCASCGWLKLELHLTVRMAHLLMSFRRRSGRWQASGERACRGTGGPSSSKAFGALRVRNGDGPRASKRTSAVLKLKEFRSIRRPKILSLASREI